MKKVTVIVTAEFEINDTAVDFTLLKDYVKERLGRVAGDMIARPCNIKEIRYVKDGELQAPASGK